MKKIAKGYTCQTSVIALPSWAGGQFFSAAIRQHTWGLFAVLPHHRDHPALQNQPHTQQPVHDGRPLLQQVHTICKHFKAFGMYKIEFYVGLSKVHTSVPSRY